MEPQDHIRLIAPRPFLYAATERDELTGPIENSKSVFARAREPKQFQTLHNHHLATYYTREVFFDLNVLVLVQFVKKYLS